MKCPFSPFLLTSPSLLKRNTDTKCHKVFWLVTPLLKEAKTVTSNLKKGKLTQRRTFISKQLDLKGQFLASLKFSMYLIIFCIWGGGRQNTDPQTMDYPNGPSRWITENELLLKTFISKEYYWKNRYNLYTNIAQLPCLSHSSIWHLGAILNYKYP